MVRKYKDAIIYLVGMLFGAAVWIYAELSIGGEPGFQIDGRLFPKCIALLMVLTSAIGCINAVLAARRTTEPEKKEAPSNKGAIIRALIMAVIMLVYALLLETVGFVASTIVVVGVVLWLVRARNIKSYIAVYTVCAVIYCIFTFLLRVRLP